MKYIGITKCIFISETHVIFDYKIQRCECDNNGEFPVKAEGDIIVDSKLMISEEGIHVGNYEAIKNELEKVKEKCKKRAKWIFAGMDNDIDNED